MPRYGLIGAVRACGRHAFAWAAALCCVVLSVAHPLAAQTLHPDDWQEMGEFAQPVNCIYFLPSAGDPVTGFVGTGEFESGHGSIYRTADSGHTWSAANMPIGPEEAVTDILFMDAATGWASTSSAREPQGGIYATTDGGITWARTTAAPGVYLGLGFSQTSGLLFAGRGGAAAVVSADHGLTWQPLLDASVTSFGFVDDSIGFAAGSHRFMPNGATFAVTTDGGNTWHSTSLNKECYQPVMIPGSHEIFAIDDGTGALYRSRDLGMNWDTIYRFNAPRQWMSGSIRGNKCGRLYAQSGYSTDLGLVTSDDRGLTWSELRPASVTSPITNSIDTRFYSENDVVYAGRYAQRTGDKHTLFRYRRAAVGQGLGNTPKALERSVALLSHGCEYTDTNLSIVYPEDCATVNLTSAQFSDSIHFQLLDEPLPKRLSSVTPLHVAYVPDGLGPNASSLILTYQSGDACVRDTIEFTGALQPGRSLTRLMLQQASSTAVSAGDTVAVAISLKDPLPAGMGLNTLSFALGFEPDLLSPIGAVASTSWQPSTASLLASQLSLKMTAPATDLPQGAIVATVRFRVNMTVDTASVIALRDIHWDGPSFIGCDAVQSSMLPVIVHRTDRCADDLLHTQLVEAPVLRIVSVTSEPDHLEARVRAIEAATLRCKLVNEAGEIVSASDASVAAGTTRIEFTKPSTPGMYYLVLERPNGALVMHSVIVP